MVTTRRSKLVSDPPVSPSQPRRRRSPADNDNVSHTDSMSSSASAWHTVGLIVRLGRPKFLMYSLVCHLAGVLVARHQQGRPIDWAVFLWLQLCVWATHLMTHYINDYADRHVDACNRNAGSWTGGSRVLVHGWLKPATARRAAWLCFGMSLLFGSMTVLRFTLLIGSSSRSAMAPGNSGDPGFFALDSVWNAPSVLRHAPWDFVAIGVSVMAVAAAYSLPPLRLSARGLGELCVSYVLTAACPAVGCLAQGGRLTLDLAAALAPLFVVNAVRMLVMNIPDRAGDARGGKRTSVVLLGERGAVMLHNVVTVYCFGFLVPWILPLARPLRLAYSLTLPYRWWLSLHLNQPGWWTDKQATDQLPFFESIFVLITASALCCGLFFS